MEWIKEKLDTLPGNISFICKNLKTGESFAYRPEAVHGPASVIKLFLMAAIYQGFEDGDFRPGDKIPVRREDCVPSCGVLTYLDDGKEVSLRDLVELMIIVSDNTATNVLADFYTIPRLLDFIHERLGLQDTFFRRKMFDAEASRRGIQNATTAQDVAWLLEKIWRGELVSPEASARMLKTLRHQRLNGKIPFRLHTLEQAPRIAHKTGEDDGTTHDVGIIEGETPLLVCFMGNETDVPTYERMIADISWELYHQA
ncbi:MAG: serine hydrolase [Clostridia bacterium]|nr:serine hydrolase [Clostridia bacterium]